MLASSITLLHLHISLICQLLFLCPIQNVFISIGDVLFYQVFLTRGLPSKKFTKDYFLYFFKSQGSINLSAYLHFLFKPFEQYDMRNPCYICNFKCICLIGTLFADVRACNMYKFMRSGFFKCLILVLYVPFLLQSVDFNAYGQTKVVNQPV